MNIRRDRLSTILVTIAAALILTLVPLPTLVDPLRPYWVALVLIYWCLETQGLISLGLAFVIALPIISVLLTAYYGGKLIAARWGHVAGYVKNVALFLAAPFIGLVYIIALPFVGFGTLVYVAVKAARK